MRCSKYPFVLIFGFLFALMFSVFSAAAQETSSLFLFQTRNTKQQPASNENYAPEGEIIQFPESTSVIAEKPSTNWSEMIVVGTDENNEEHFFTYTIEEKDPLECTNQEKKQKFSEGLPKGTYLGRAGYSPLNETLFYFSVCKGDTEAEAMCDIFSTRYESGDWTPPSALLSAKQPGEKYITPHMGIDDEGEEVLFFAYKGQQDPFFTLKKVQIDSLGKANGHEQLVIPKKYSSSGDYIAPFHDYNNRKVYFSFRESLSADYDIWVLDEATEKPKKLPASINSTELDEVYFSLIKGSDKGIFVRSPTSKDVQSTSIHYFNRNQLK